MIFKKIKTFLKKIRMPGLYVGRSLKTVPEGSLVLFPYEPAVLSCGITGVLAFKKPSIETGDSTIRNLERKLETLFEHSGRRLENKELEYRSNYLGGRDLLREIKRLCDKFKGNDVFFEAFSDRSCQEKLSDLCAKLEGMIEAEDSAMMNKKGRVEGKPATGALLLCRNTSSRSSLRIWRICLLSGMAGRRCGASPCPASPHC